MISVNKTIQVLDVSNNGFGKMQKGDQVKLKSSGILVTVSAEWGSGLRYFESSGKESSNIKSSEFEWEGQVPALCAGVAASPSLTSVSTTFRCPST
jgi:hypothetical protein